MSSPIPHALERKVINISPCIRRQIAFENSALRTISLRISPKPLPLDSKRHYRLKVRALAVHAPLCSGTNYRGWD
jgi:hypothetical protein